MNSEEIYLDEAATSKVREQVLETMKPFFLEKYGNASSLHEKGEEAARAMNQAREKLAKEINAKSHEIIFTSGSTESNNMALKATSFKSKRKIIISAIEHPSVKESAEFLKKNGFEIIEIPMNNEGKLDLKLLEKEVDENTAIVSICHADNIIGSIRDLEAIGKICANHNVIFHTDATQSFGKLDIDVKKSGISMLSASAHKIGGPKGVGLLYVKDGLEVKPLFNGGGQERGFRSGTENIAGIVGFAKALELTKEVDKEKIRRIREKMTEELEKIGGKINSQKSGLYNLINVSFLGIDNKTLVTFLSEKGVYVSAGSACDSKKEKEDYVLKALSISKERIDSSIRISIPFDFKEEKVEFVVKAIEESLEKLKI